MITFAAAQEAAFILAQAVPTVTITPAEDPSVISISHGIISEILSYVGTVLVALLMWAFRFLPHQVYSLMMTMRVDQLLLRATQFGINTTVGASPDKVMNLDIGNKVLREAVKYALQHGGPLVKNFMGSPEAIAEKLWARLQIAQETPKPAFPEIADKAEAKAIIEAPVRAAEVVKA